MSGKDFERIAILGAGAVGCVFGALLSEAGSCDVILVSRNEAHVDAINLNGLVVKTPEGDEESITVRADTRVSGEEPDLIVLTVKAYDVGCALEPVKNLSCPVLCLQNGIGIEEIASSILGGGERVVRGVAFMGATFLGPGCVMNAGIGEVLIGQSEHSKKIAGVFSGSGIPTKVAEDITDAVWTKSLVNCGLNAFGALTGLKNGELLEVPELETEMLETIREGEEVAKCLGLSVDDPSGKLLRIAKAMAANKNSMLQDIEKGKKTEIDFLNGAISRLGKQNGVPTPRNDLMTALVKGLEFIG